MASRAIAARASRSTGWRASAPPACRRDTAAAVVHAINPYGFAWTRRVTEEGNDLNRNYVDHSKPYPVNEGYLEIADYLVPKDMSEAGIKAAEAKLAEYRKKVGDIAYFRAVSGGQYSHPDGMFFGGGGPSWSNRTLHAIADKFLKGRSDVAVIDFHTGLGPYGYGEPITHYDIDTPASRRVRAFWGESVTESKRGQTASQARDGLGHYGLNRVLTGARDAAHHVHPGIRHLRPRERPEGVPRRPLAAQVRRSAGQGGGAGARRHAAPVLSRHRRLEGGGAVPRPPDRAPGHRRRAARRLSRSERAASPALADNPAERSLGYK